MATNHTPDSPNQLIDTHMSHSVNKKNEHNVTSDTADSPRKRSTSFVNWIQKTLTHVKGTHEHSFKRERAATTTAAIIPTARPRTGSQSTVVPIDEQVLIQPGRGRSKTVGSVGSTNKKIVYKKKQIPSTDARVQQPLPVIRFFP